MAEKVRYNKIIDLLERGKPVFSTSTVPNGNLDDLTYIADADYDAVIIEMEHEGFSFTTLRTSLQVLLNRKRIAEKGNLQPDVVPMVRIPPNARERNQWVIKQALDTGVYGSRFGTGVNASPLIDRPQNVKPPAGPVALCFNPRSGSGWAYGAIVSCFLAERALAAEKPRLQTVRTRRSRRGTCEPRA